MTSPAPAAEPLLPEGRSLTRPGRTSVSRRLGAASFAVLWTLAARAGDMVIEANFHPHSEYELDKLRGLGDRIVEVHCACPAEVAVARYNARTRHEVHWLKTLRDGCHVP